MVLLVVLTVLLAGSIILLLHTQYSLSRIDTYLLKTRDQFVKQAQKGVNTETQQPFKSPSELLGYFMERTIFDGNAGELGVVDGKINWVGNDAVTLRPEDDPELVEHLLPLTQLDDMTLGSITTSQHSYRYHVAPIIFPDSRGAFVHVYNLEALNVERNRLLWIILLVGVVASLGAAGLAWILIERMLAPVEALRKAAESIDDSDLTMRVPITGNDDLTTLSKTINRMLDRLQASIENQRRLLDDVGHELRTPLTIVRGHLELMSSEDPADVEQTKDLTIDELDRMGKLVEDLLILAKANQYDFVQPEWFSLATLTDQTLEKARALGRRKWRLSSIESVEAWLDPNRIIQAWLQLAANAVKYSAEGAAISLGTRIVGGEAYFICADQGVGINSDELTTIRSRFGRGSNIGQASGAGLGLAIVESIVSAHHGRLEIESEPGVGSVFTIVIPISPKEEQVDEHDFID